MAENTLFVDMEVDELANFIFVKNVNNAIIELSLGGVENNKDLFCFFVDLLCKGLVLLFGNGNKVSVDQLTLDDFEKIKKKLACAGIRAMLECTENNGDIVGVNLYELEKHADDDPLESFMLKLTSDTMVYKVMFSLSQNVL